jgi:hypothetical protein
MRVAPRHKVQSILCAFKVGQRRVPYSRRARKINADIPGHIGLPRQLTRPAPTTRQDGALSSVRIP